MDGAALGVAPLSAPAGWGAMPCIISPLQTVDLAAPVTGVIESVAVKPGQQVQKGDVIAVFDSATIRSELAIAQMRARSTKALEIARDRLAGLEKRLQRLTAATKSRAVPAADLENAQLEVDVARGELGRETEAIELAKLEMARAQIMVDKSTVRATASGSIGEVLIDPGETPTQEPIATIYVTTPMKIEAYVPTQTVADFLTAGGFTAQIAGQAYDVALDHRANVADVSSNTLSVYFRLDAADVLPGLDCKITTTPPKPKE